jgi:hypothetical protein
MTKQAVDGTIRSIIDGIGVNCESSLEVALALAIGIAARRTTLFCSTSGVSRSAAILRATSP